LRYRTEVRSWPLLLVLSGLLGAAGGCRLQAASPPSSALAERFGDAPWLTPLPQVGPLSLGEVSVGVRAQDCGACHVDVYREWREATHASAVSDLQYLAELQKPSSPRWLCLNCHAPVQNQREVLIDGSTRVSKSGPGVGPLVHARENPGFDPLMRDEGVTCATCHVRKDEAGQTVVVGPSGRGTAPHPVRHDKSALREVCLRCHSPGQAQPSPTFVCWFETQAELQKGPLAGQKDCVDCHMPAVERPLVPGGPERKTRHHHWVGGGVPKSFEAYEGLLARGYEPGVDVTVRLLDKARAGKPLTVEVLLKNPRAGHALPTGDPERHLLARVTLEDEGGRALARESLRLGQRWDWGDDESGRSARRLEDTRLAPGEVRPWRLLVALPARSPKGLRLVVDVAHVRLAPENARSVMRTRLDDELAALRPGAQGLLEKVGEHYPLYTEVFRQEVALPGGEARTTPLMELLKRSQAARAGSLQAAEERLKTGR
jgi:nitrate reductase cytochrome c-type subunit